MVGAGDQPRLEPATFLAAKLRAPVTAAVVEGVEPALFVADDQDLLAGERDDAIGTGLGKLGGAAGEDPAAVPDRLQVLRRKRRLQNSFSTAASPRSGRARRNRRSARHPSRPPCLRQSRSGQGGGPMVNPAAPAIPPGNRSPHP